MACLVRTSAAWVALAGALVTATSYAAPPADAVARARHLFSLAEADEDAERWSDALDKFRAVSQVKLTAGVRYHLALCEEHVGQLARAYTEYQAAETQAQLENAVDVTRLVGKQLLALRPRVPRLTLRVAPALPDVSLKLDGELLVDPLAGAAIPLDPGLHHIEATAPDRPVSTVVVTLQEGESRSLDVLLAEPHSGASRIPSPIPTPTPGTGPSRRLAIAATAVGIGLAGGGVAAFLIAGSERDHAVATCAQDFQPDACSGLILRVRALDFTAAAAWTGAVISGGIALVLWTRGSDATTRAGAHLIVGPGTIGAWGHF